MSKLCRRHELRGRDNIVILI